MAGPQTLSGKEAGRRERGREREGGMDGRGGESGREEKGREGGREGGEGREREIVHVHWPHKTLFQVSLPLDPF